MAEGLLNAGVVGILGEGGSFSRVIDNFKVRDSQVELASTIAAAIANKGSLLAESGTGTGKTYAYLVPTFLSGKKTLISTGTKHLQEQLFHRDIPLVLKTMGSSGKVALLKGRSNYLCLERLRQARTSARRLDKKLVSELEAISLWVATTKSGDIAEIDTVPEDSRIWPLATSTVDNCVGQACGYFEDCHVNKARKNALSADVVVINHHLFFADKALKEDGFGALLPSVDTVIFDEAHQIPDIASNFLGDSFSSWQINELVADVKVAEVREKSLLPKLIPMAETLDKLMSDYRLSFGLNERRVAWTELLEELPSLSKKIDNLVDRLIEFSDELEKAASRGELLTRCFERSLELLAVCRALAKSDAESDNVRWVEIAKRSFRIHETPLHIGKELSSFFANKEQARIFTSATLSIDNNFTHFQKLMGLPADVELKSWPSPFDFFNQAVLYVPEGLPEPRNDDFSSAMFAATLPLLQASNGRAFVLFTSFKIMQQFYEKLIEYDFNVLMQGERNKSDLLSNFVTTKRSVLLGTMSFWEGVDVPGNLLSLVVIDKLPFESPFDPVIKARLAAMQDAGENSFMHYQVPRAVITLRQGAGRLIRNQMDKGVLMLCDTRLRGTHYGKVFLNSLPPMRRTTDESKVVGFLRTLNSDKKSDGERKKDE